VKAYLKKVILFCGITGLVAVLICTGYQEYKKEKLIVKTLHEDIHLPKAAIAKACNRDETYCLDNVVLVVGEISDSTVSDVNKLLETWRDKGITTVCFDTQGGNIHDASSLGQWILKNGLSTCMAETYFIKDKNDKPRQLINTKCDSACNYLLLASNKRIAIGQSYKIATHSAGVNVSLCICNVPLSSGFMNSFIFKSLLDREDNPDKDAHLEFLALSKRVSFADSYKLTLSDIQRFRIFTETMGD